MLNTDDKAANEEDPILQGSYSSVGITCGRLMYSVLNAYLIEGGIPGLAYLGTELVVEVVAAMDV